MLIIHGDNTIVSRDFFLTQKKSFPNILELSGEDLTFARLTQALATPNLFGELPTLFIENFFSRRPSNEKKKIIEFLNKCQNDGNVKIITYDSKDMSLQLKSFDPKIIKNFKLPKFIYSFLESFSLDQLQLVLKSEAPEMILGSMARHIHNLILVKENQSNLPSWQAGKLKSQAQNFTLEQLVKFNKDLLAIDYRQKTSSSPLNLKQALELWSLKTGN